MSKPETDPAALRVRLEEGLTGLSMRQKPTALTRKQIEGVMAETVHTAFRKGSDHPDADKVWHAIQAMDNQA